MERPLKKQCEDYTMGVLLEAVNVKTAEDHGSTHTLWTTRRGRQVCPAQDVLLENEGSATR